MSLPRTFLALVSVEKDKTLTLPRYRFLRKPSSFLFSPPPPPPPPLFAAISSLLTPVASMDDSCSCVDETVESNPSYPKSCKDLDAIDPNFELPSLGPLTPDTTKENGNFPFNLNSPPTLPKLLISESNTNDIPASPKTPKDGVFDPFAPGPNEMAMAPHCKKYLDEARASVSRCLNFTSSFRRCSFDADFFTDEEMFETVYENLLEAIVFKQTEGALTQVPNEECDSDACRTPPLAPRLTGLAETCPGAPLKSTVKSRVIDLGLCRKLEF